MGLEGHTLKKNEKKKKNKKIKKKKKKTNSLTPYTGGFVFFLSVKFATSLLVSMAGENRLNAQIE